MWAAKLTLLGKKKQRKYLMMQSDYRIIINYSNYAYNYN
jgi:hypothetical protein